MEVEIIELTEVYRQKDAKFINLLDRLRNGDNSDDLLEQINTRYQSHVSDEDDGVITLTATNRVADTLNEKRLNSLPGDMLEFEAELEGDFPGKTSPTMQTLRLKPGARVMLLTNDSQERWVNGSIGVVQGLERDSEGDKHLAVRLGGNNRTVLVPRHKWEMYQYTLEKDTIVPKEAGSFTQYPVRLAWAITIHKSQGQTFDRMIIDTGRGLFAHGHAYVALSRCSSLEGITLKKRMTMDDICIDPEVNHAFSEWILQQVAYSWPMKQRLLRVRDAIAGKKKLNLLYVTRDHNRTRCLITPLSLSKKEHEGEEFHGLTAEHHDHNQSRLFRLDRILSLEVAP